MGLISSIRSFFGGSNKNSSTPSTSSTASAPSSSSSSSSTSSYQGPQRPGYSFTHGGGSAPTATPTVQYSAPIGPQRPSGGGGSSVRTVTGGTSYLAEGATPTPSSGELGGPVIQSSEVTRVSPSSRAVVVSANTTPQQAIAGQGVTTVSEARSVRSTPYTGVDQSNVSIGYPVVRNLGEERYLQSRGVVAYGIEPGMTPQNALTMGTTLATMPYYGFGKTAGTFEQNLISKNIAKDIYSFQTSPSTFSKAGWEVTSTPSGEYTLQYTLQAGQNLYFEKYKEYKDVYATLPSSTQARLQLGEAGVRIQQMGAGLVNFPINALKSFGGGMTNEKGEFVTLKTNIDVFPSISAKPVLTTGLSFKTQPLEATAERLKLSGQNWGVMVTDIVTAGLAVYTIRSGFKGAGSFKEGLVETAGMFSPIRVKSGIYTYTPPKDEYFIQSVKSGQSRIYFGTDVGSQVKIGGAEVTRGTDSFGIQETRVPALEIKGGGVYVNEGVRQIVSVKGATPYYAGGGKIGSMSNELFVAREAPGSVTRIYSFTADNLVYKGGGVKSLTVKNPFSESFQVVVGKTSGRVSFFRSGKGTAEYGVDLKQDTYIWQPKTIRGKANIRGIELDITPSQEPSISGGFKVSRTNKPFGGSTETLVDMGTTMAKQETVSLPKQSTVQSSVMEGPSVSVGNLKTITTDKVRLATVQQSSTRILQTQQPQTLQLTQPQTLQLTQPQTLQLTQPQTLQLTQPQTLQLTQPQTLQLTQPQTLQLTSPRTVEGYIPPRIFEFPKEFPPFPFPSLGGAGGRMGGRMFKGKGRTKYTPSYMALVKNIKGKSSTTKMGIRPITPGFKWSFSEGKLPFRKGGFKL